ncbi:MAG TPA: alpha/beta fold hydrolase [Pantanalinema sp.]
MEQAYNLRGARLRAYVRGEGAPILFIHGTGGNGKTWFNQLRRFGLTRTAIAIDLPGYGESELPPGVESVDDYAALVAEWMALAGWARPVVVGTSMGGRVALQLALDHPDRVGGLVLIDASGIRVEGVPTLSPAELGVEQFLRALFYRPSPTLGRTATGEPPAWYATMQRLTAKPLRSDMQARLGEIRLPTLVLWGEHDRILPPAYAEAFHAAIPGSRLCWIPEAGHVPMIERPGAVNDAIADFLTTLPRP